MTYSSQSAMKLLQLNILFIYQSFVIFCKKLYHYENVCTKKINQKSKTVGNVREAVENVQENALLAQLALIVTFEPFRLLYYILFLIAIIILKLFLNEALSQ